MNKWRTMVKLSRSDVESCEFPFGRRQHRGIIGGLVGDFCSQLILKAATGELQN
jgi:hypothetical protein